MSVKRLLSCVTILFLGVVFIAGTAQATHPRTYSLGDSSGGQIHIGNGLPLPIQPKIGPTATGAVFPPLLIPLAPGPQTIMQTKQKTVQKDLWVPASVLSKVATQLTLGLFTSNPSVYAVATNLGFKWPGSGVSAHFSTGNRTGAKTVKFTSVSGNTIRYSNPLASKFGGPARFLANAGVPTGLMPLVPVTVYAVAVPGPGPTGGNPPCTHVALVPPFPGTFVSPACVAALLQALPSLASVGPMKGAHGGPVGLTVSTPGGTPAAVIAMGPVPGIGIGKFGMTPLGTVSFFAFTGGTAMGGFNPATSHGYPWTTGMLTITAPTAVPPEIFMITGGDTRNSSGVGVIQMVAGSLSQRTVTGPNANRAWVRLEIERLLDVPALSRPMRGVAVGIILLVTVGFVMRSRRNTA